MKMFEMFKSSPNREQTPVKTNEQSVENKSGVLKAIIEKVKAKIQEIISSPQSVVEKNLADPEKRKEVIKKILWMAAVLAAAGVAVGGMVEMTSYIGGPDNDFGSLSPADAYKPLVALLTSMAASFGMVYSIAQASIENKKNVSADVIGDKKMERIEGIAA